MPMKGVKKHTDRLRKLRRVLASALPLGPGRASLTLRLALYRADPTYEVSEAPVLAWAEAYWDNRVGPDLLFRAWRTQMRRLGPEPMWRDVRGPVSYTHLTLPTTPYV